jgi:hypothetical protein
MAKSEKPKMKERSDQNEGHSVDDRTNEEQATKLVATLLQRKLKRQEP